MLEEIRNAGRWAIPSHRRKTPVGTRYRQGDVVLIDHGPKHSLPVAYYLVVHVMGFHVDVIDLRADVVTELTASVTAISDIIPPEQVPPALWPKVVAWRLTHGV